MGQLSGPDGRPLDKGIDQAENPGLDMSKPGQSLDLLGSVGRSSYIMAAQYASPRVAGPKGERHIKIPARDISSIASQGAAVAEFASNVISELAFTLAEAEARVAVLMGQIPEDKLQAARESDLGVAVEWENRRRLFSGSVAILLKQGKRLGPALALSIAGPAPSEDDFKTQVEAAKAAGLNVVEDAPRAAPMAESVPEGATTETESPTQEAPTAPEPAQA